MSSDILAILLIIDDCSQSTALSFNDHEKTERFMLRSQNEVITKTRDSYVHEIISLKSD